jgi:hypothetical protein
MDTRDHNGHPHPPPHAPPQLTARRGRARRPRAGRRAFRAQAEPRRVRPRAGEAGRASGFARSGEAGLGQHPRRLPGANRSLVYGRPASRSGSGADRPSLPCAAIGNRSQPTATVFACLSRFRRRAVCDRLPPVATTGLHKGSILSRLFGQRRRLILRLAAALAVRGSLSVLTTRNVGRGCD